MEKWTILFMCFFALKALSQESELKIDCGSETTFRDENNTVWWTDNAFIKTGENKWVSRNSYTKPVQQNTLRVFKQQNKNCYTLPTPTVSRYFIRAVFYYGNYDWLAKPPTFNLELDGNKWTTVETSISGSVYHEVIYPSKRDYTSVCLSRTKDREFPFISMLEIWPLPNAMYAAMSTGRAWLKSYRYDYGAVDWIVGYPDDQYDRIWEPITLPGLQVVTANFTSLDQTTAELPPDSAMIQAIEAPSPADPINLAFKISKTNGINFLMAYFTEVVQDSSAVRSFDFYVNDEFIETISPEYQNCIDAWASTSHSSNTLKVELRPRVDSTLPPLISAIEVYAASDPLLTVETSQDDLDGLGAFVRTFEQLEGWSGDPCVPSDTVWQWLRCTGDNPPRVTSINLSGYGLDGPLPDFSQMQALETINLGNNNLDGPIPDFLGGLPKLRLLILRDNNFSGDIPLSITSNKKLSYDFNGNPNLNGNQDLYYNNGKRLGLIIGLSVGLTLGIVLVIVLVFLYRRQLRRAQGDTTTDQAKPLQEENGSTSMSSKVPISPSHSNSQNMPTAPAEENFPVTKNAGKMSQNGGNETHEPFQGDGHAHEPMAPGENIPVSFNAGGTNHHFVATEIDMEEDSKELNELIDQHGSKGADGRT